MADVPTLRPPNVYRLQHPPGPVCSDALLLYLPLAALELPSRSRL